MLGAAAQSRHTISLGGHFSKRQMAGPVEPSDVTISTARLQRVLQYEPSDLTISVEAGISHAELSRTLAPHNQMVPLDPPFSENATIGGILAANSSGYRRRLHGTARDFVIGMKFATLEGKLVQSGGMVVKNVAGLDMGKLMIGSFGTLAAIAVVNFKVTPMPAVERTCLLSFDSLTGAIEIRDRILGSVLQPAAIDLLHPLVSAQLGYKGFLLAMQFGGNDAVVERCQREISALGRSIVLNALDAARFWNSIQEFTPRFLEKFRDGAVVRVSSTLTRLTEIFESLEVPAIARAGSGVSYAYFHRSAAAAKWVAAAVKKNWKAVIEFAPEAEKAHLDLWPAPGSDFAMMKKVKHMFDPNQLLNRGRLYRLL